MYERKVTPLERFFSLSPYSIVTMVARIRGKVTEDMLSDAVKKVQKRHINLNVRIKSDEEHTLWFTSENVKEIPIQVIPRESEKHWISIHTEESKKPFEFDKRPAIRFLLVQSQKISELIILCHHIICDGLSLAYLARDIMVYLGDPEKKVEILPNPTPIDLSNLPKNVSLNPVVKFFINRINRGWQKDKIHFDLEDYQNLNEAYWMNAKHRILSIELTESQTDSLVKLCKDENTTVNSVITTAFVGSQQIIYPDRKILSSIAIAGNLREHIQIPAGEEMGFFAGAITLEFSYNKQRSFWDNTRRLNQKVQPLYTTKNLFKEQLNYCYLEPGILESFNFKKLGVLVPNHFSKYEKISAFSKKNDVISSILKRENMESLDKVILGTAVTNLTRMDFPRTYGNLELDRLMMNPGGAFPLSNVSLVVGVVTCSGKLSIILEYEESALDTHSVEKIKKKAMEFLQVEELGTQSLSVD
jgi:NRPS condensation-like uncharacterized protein